MRKFLVGVKISGSHSARGLGLMAVIVGAYGVAFLFHSFGFEYFSSLAGGVSVIIACISGIVFPFASAVFLVASSGIDVVRVFPESIPFALRPYQLIAVTTALGAIITLIRFGRGSAPKISVPDIGVILLVFGGWGAVMFSAYPEESLRLSIIFTSFAFIYAVVRVFFDTRERLVRVLPFVLAGGVASALYGIFQNVTFAQGIILPGVVMSGRPNALFSEPDWFGLYMALMMVLACFVFIRFGMDREEKAPADRFVHIALWIVLAFVNVALIISVSRSAWLACSVGVGSVFLWSWWHYGLRILRRWLMVGLSVGVALMYISVFSLTQFELFNRAQSSVSALQEITISCTRGVTLPEIVDQDILSSFGCRHINLEEREGEIAMGNFVTRAKRLDPNASIRKEVWEKSISAIVEHPITGIGWADISVLLGKDPRGQDLNTSNIFLALWLGGGILALSGALLITVWIVTRALTLAWFRGGIGYDSAGLVLATCAVVGVFSLFNASDFLGLFWIWLGLAVSALVVDSERKTLSSQIWTRAYRRIIRIVGL